MAVDVGNLSDTIKWLDWLVFGAVLAASLGIGAFYGFCGNRNRTNEEFLMAGRSMSILPVTMSLLCSFVSAVTLLGNPVEIYFYGIHYTLIAFAFIPLTFVLAYLYVPVYFELQLTSAYEYFEWRFSKKARYVVSVFAMCHLLVYMPITVFGPSLALDQVADINYRLTAAMIFIVCILYSSVGGLKAVLWTDALQAVVMFFALAMVIGLGLKEVGGISHVWETATDGNRMNWWVWDGDLRTRHTFWTATIGGYLLWLPLFGATQAQIQRYNSVPTLRQSRMTLLFNMFGMMLVICLCSLIGIIIYTNYADCDPVEAKMVQSADQLLPLFVLQVLGKYSGIPGLLIAGLTCGSLSTVSSALNSLAAILTEDYVKVFRPGLSEERLGLISKVISAISGTAAFGLVFIVAIINETIQISPFSTLLHGAMIGPILAGFTLGMIFPWVNDWGMFTGLLGGAAFSLFIGIGNIIAGIDGKLPNQRKNVTTVGCTFTEGEIGQEYSHEFWKEEHADDSALTKMFSLSYIWLPGVGFISTFILGVLFSAVFYLFNRRKSNMRINVKLMSKPFIRFWVWVFGQERMETFVDFVPFDFGDRLAKQDQKEKAALEASLPEYSDYSEMKLPRVELITNGSRKMFNGSTEMSTFSPDHRLSQTSFKKVDAF